MPFRLSRSIICTGLISLAACHRDLPSPAPSPISPAPIAREDVQVVDVIAPNDSGTPRIMTAAESVLRLRATDSLAGNDPPELFANIDVDHDGVPDALFEAGANSSCALARLGSNGWHAFALPSTDEVTDQHCLAPIQTATGTVVLIASGTGHEVINDSPNEAPSSDTWKEWKLYAADGPGVREVGDIQLRNQELETIGDIAFSAFPGGGLLLSAVHDNSDSSDAGGAPPYLAFAWNSPARRFDPASCWRPTVPTSPTLEVTCTATPHAAVHLRTFADRERNVDNDEIPAGTSLNVLERTSITRGRARLYCVSQPGSGSDSARIGYVFLVPQEFGDAGCAGLSRGQ